jgi:hypothetical protein
MFADELKNIKEISTTLGVLIFVSSQCASLLVIKSSLMYSLAASFVEVLNVINTSSPSC